MTVNSSVRAGAFGLAICSAVAVTATPVKSAATGGEHPHHHHEVQGTPYRKSVHSYRLPDVKLVRDDGTEVSFPAEIDDGRPVVLNFIYTTCTAICPLLSQTFAVFQKELGPAASELRMVSISIDPDQDTPERLAEYAKRYQAGPQWSHYTGSPEASVEVQQAFNAYYVDKMNHRPVVFLRAAPGEPWVRLDGFTSPDDLMKEYRALGQAG